MKKLITPVIAMAIVAVSALALTACKQETPPVPVNPIEGKAGSLDWSLDKKGTLTVSGAGAIPDYAVPSATRAAGANNAPWGAYAAEIKAIVISSGVTGIGSNAFANLTVLVTVTLPDTIGSIGGGAFAGCPLLVDITIPPRTEIGNGAFKGCDDLVVHVWSVTLNITSLPLSVGGNETLSAIVAPALATDKSVTWSSSNPAVATVDATTGVVTAVAQGTATITATTTDGKKQAHCAVTVRVPDVVITDPPLSQEALDEFVGSYTAMADAYVAIDNDYSTLAARETLSSSTPALSVFWGKAYVVINLSGIVISRMDTDGERSEEEKAKWKGRAQLYRAKAYLWLTTLFGRVPLVTGNESLEELMAPAASSVDEINDFVLMNLGEAIDRLPQDEVAQALFANLLVTASRNEPQRVRMIVDEMANRGALTLADINGDGIINSIDMNAANLPAAQARLFGAESAITMGDMLKAVEYLNGLTPVQPPIALSDVKALWPSRDKAMKFMNLSRRGETASWGYRALLPIPRRELDTNPRLTQNPGW